VHTIINNILNKLFENYIFYEYYIDIISLYIKLLKKTCTPVLYGDTPKTVHKRRLPVDLHTMIITHENKSSYHETTDCRKVRWTKTSH